MAFSTSGLTSGTLYKVAMRRRAEPCAAPARAGYAHRTGRAQASRRLRRVALLCGLVVTTKVSHPLIVNDSLQTGDFQKIEAGDQIIK